MTQAKLAALTGINRTVLARILANEPGRGKETRPKLFPHLTTKEIDLLGWQLEYLQWADQNAPRSTPFPMAQSSMGNIVPDAQTP